MHGKDTAADINFHIPLQMTLEHLLVWRWKQNTKWATEISNIKNTYV